MADKQPASKDPEQTETSIDRDRTRDETESNDTSVASTPVSKEAGRKYVTDS